MMRRGVVGLSLLALLVGGCEDGSLRARPRSNGNGKAECNPVVAEVDGNEIRQEELLAVVLADQGGAVLADLIALRLACAEAERVRVRVSEEDVATEFQAVLDDMAPGQSWQQQRAMLAYLLASRGMSRARFDVIVELQAVLRKIVQTKWQRDGAGHPEAVVTEADCRQEYERHYGEQVQIRQVVMSSFRKADTVLRRVQAGEDLATLVREYSEDQASLARDGLVGPFSAANDEVPEKVRTAAFALSFVGEHSGIISYLDGINEQWWAVIELVSRTAAQHVPFEQVQAELADDIQQRRLRQAMRQLQQRLREEARVVILDGRLQQSNGRTTNLFGSE